MDVVDDIVEGDEIAAITFEKEEGGNGGRGAMLSGHAGVPHDNGCVVSIRSLCR